LELANREREENGLPLFTIDFNLVKLARVKSEEMFTDNYFSHISPVHGSMLDMLRVMEYLAG